jgi:hypothetical protein
MTGARGDLLAAAVEALAVPFEVGALAAASDWEAAPGIIVRTCSAEDLVVYKLVAARTRDIGDVEGIVRRQGSRLDVERIRCWGRVMLIQPSSCPYSRE